MGCLNGHAIHAACAADLALGGGVCPTCRAPLYYAQVPKAEVEAAKLLAKDLSKEFEQADKQGGSGVAHEFEVGDQFPHQRRIAAGAVSLPHEKEIQKEKSNGLGVFVFLLPASTDRTDERVWAVFRFFPYFHLVLRIFGSGWI